MTTVAEPSRTDLLAAPDTAGRPVDNPSVPPADPHTTAGRQADAPDRAPARRVAYFDYLRLFATIGVVLIHGSTQVYNATRDGGAANLGTFVVASSGQAVGRFAVGCFFMMSGALLVDANKRFRLGKQLARVGVPLLVWSGVYLLVNSWWDARGLPTTSAGGDQTGHLSDTVHALLSGSISSHFWFVYALMACYLALPLLRPIAALPALQAKRLFEYALAIWAVTFLVIPTVNHYSPDAIHLYPDAVPALPSMYLGFVLLGYYLHRWGVRIRDWEPRRAALVASAVFAFVMIVALDVADKLRGVQPGWAQTNPTMQVVLLGASVFLLAKCTLNRPGRRFGFVALVSRISFRIYLVHKLIMWWLQNISPLRDLYTEQAEVSIVVISAITLVISFAIAYGLEQISSIRRWI